jgi:hypothetical protein
MFKTTHRRSVLLVALILGVAASILTGCTTATPFVPPKEVAVVPTSTSATPEFEVQRWDDKAWATIETSTPDTLVVLSDSIWHDLIGQGMVTTDTNGQAEIRGPGCGSLFIYQDSGLQRRDCERGGASSSCVTGAILNKDCDVVIDTLPATVSFLGTWVSVIYLPGSEVTLVIVGEGVAAVTPYKTVSYEREGDGPLDFVATGREATDEVVIKVPGGQEPLFLYTASDERLAELMEGQELPPPRQPRSIEELAPVQVALSARDPILDRWLGEIREQGPKDGIPIPPPPPPPPTLVTLVDGEVFPNLATEWFVSEDGLEWTFILAEGREMDDGTPYTSHLVHEVFTLQEQAYVYIDDYAGSEIIDDFTIRFFLGKPNPEFLQQVARVELPQ